MKKKLIVRCALGAPIGLAMSTAITIVISFCFGDGNFYPVVPQLIDDFGTEINAVTVQAICSLFYGAACAGASTVWEMEEWSMLRQTITHLIVCSLSIFPIAYLMRWMEHSLGGILKYFGIFFAIYLIIWIFMYFSIKKKIRQMNQSLKRENQEVN